MTPTLDERIERLQSHYLANRIIRHSWSKGALLSDGYERACLLAAFSPEAAEAKDAAACPADAMPAWLAKLTPSLDDNVSDEAWPSIIARYVNVLPQLVRLPADRLVRLDFETRAVAVREARRHAHDPKVLEAIDSVLVLLDRAAVGQEVSKDEWAGAAAAAWAAAAGQEVLKEEAAWAAASAAKSAAWAAYAGTAATAWAAYAGTAATAWAAYAGTAAKSAAWEARMQAKSAATAAAWAAESAATAWAAEEAAESAATAASLGASWDRMASAILSAWEAAV